MTQTLKQMKTSLIEGVSGQWPLCVVEAAVRLP
jgi:hypothetical protein